MATEKAIRAYVCELLLAFGRRVEAEPLAVWIKHLQAEIPTDYQLGRAVTELIVAGGQFMPNVGQVLNAAKDEPRDPQAAIERKRRESQNVIIRTPLQGLPDEAVRLLEDGRDRAKSFAQQVKERLPHIDIEAEQQRKERRKRFARLPSEQTVADRKVNCLAVLEKIRSEESEEMRNAIEKAKSERDRPIREMLDKLRRIGFWRDAE